MSVWSIVEATGGHPASHAHVRHWIEDELQCKVEDLTSFSIDREILEIDPVQAPDGQMWKMYKHGTHLTYNALFTDGKQFSKTFPKQEMQDYKQG